MGGVATQGERDRASGGVQLGKMPFARRNSSRSWAASSRVRALRTGLSGRVAVGVSGRAFVGGPLLVEFLLDLADRCPVRLAPRVLSTRRGAAAYAATDIR